MPIERRVRRVRAGGVRRRVDRPGPPGGDARRPRRRGQDPVPGHRRGGRDRPAQPADAAAAGQAARPRARRQGAGPGAARADRRRARLRGRGPEPPRDGARLARAPVRLRPAGRHRALAAAACWSPSCSRAAASRPSSSSPRPSATASARSSSASSSARCCHLRRAAGDPHPGNYLLLDDGRVGFLDFGLMRVVDADYLAGERALAQAVDRRRRAGGARRACAHARLPPGARRLRARAPARAARRPAGEWYFEPGFRRMSPAYVTDLLERGGSPALGVLRADAARDDPAAGAADPPHGGARALRRSASCAPAPTGTRWRASTGARRRPDDAARASRTPRSGAPPGQRHRTARRLGRPCSPPPSPPSPCCLGC